MKKYILIIIVILLLALLSRFVLVREPHWQVRSIDTMKYSRDPAREKLHDSAFDKVIDRQLSAIAATGATHVAIGTPYDDEFLPILRRWVASARKHGLKVWFRGNFSGWEGWFDYPKIARSEHVSLTKQFIFKNKDLFEDGDIFTSCPECENGSGVNFGDQKEVKAYRTFLIDEYTVVKRSFKDIRKNVRGNYYSMNGDVAKIVMDRQTTKALDGVVTIDHYVSTPEKLAEDVTFFAHNSDGKVVLGEFGAPIPDINGKVSDEEQKQWLEKALKKLAMMKEIEGVNYWVNVGGSTALWRDDMSPKPAVDVITKVFRR